MKMQRVLLSIIALLLLALVLEQMTVVVLLRHHDAPAPERMATGKPLDYSLFLQQVDAGNVREVRFKPGGADVDLSRPLAGATETHFTVNIPQSPVAKRALYDKLRGAGVRFVVH